MLAYVPDSVARPCLWIVAACSCEPLRVSGWIQDRVLWQPLRRRGVGITQQMIVTIGLSLALQYTFQFFVGARACGSCVDDPDGPIRAGHDHRPVAGRRWAISVVVLGLVGFALLRTRLGRATRAVSDNPALAAASGIDVDRSSGWSGCSRRAWPVSAASCRRWPSTAPSGTRAPDAAADVRRRDARRARDGVRRAARLAGHRGRRRDVAPVRAAE